MSAWRILRIVYILPIIVNRNTIRSSQMNQQPTMTADEIDRELDDAYPHMLEHIQQSGSMPTGSVTVFGPPFLPTPADDIHRALVRRAIYRAGYTTRVVFMRGDTVMVCMGNEPELNSGLGATLPFVSTKFDAKLRSRYATHVSRSSTRWNSSVVSGFPLVTHQCTLCRQIASKKCGACASYYCSKECQRKDWRRHKTECKRRTQ